MNETQKVTRTWFCPHCAGELDIDDVRVALAAAGRRVIGPDDEEALVHQIADYRADRLGRKDVLYADCEFEARIAADALLQGETSG